MSAVKLYDTDREYKFAEIIHKQKKLINLYAKILVTLGFLICIQALSFMYIIIIMKGL